MEFTSTLQSAIFEIQEVKDLLTRFMEKKELSKIEIDLAMSKMRNIYELLLILDKLGYKVENDLTEKVTSTLVSPKEPEEPVAVMAKTVKQTASAEKKVIKKQVPPLEEEEIEMKASAKPEARQVPEPEKPVAGTSGKAKKPEIIAEKLGSQSKMLHDVLSETAKSGHKDLSSMHQSKPIKNIEDAIGINDKFLFIKELFSGNAEVYREAIEYLNRAADFNTAYQYIEHHFEWDMESDAAQKLLDLVRRRHISSQHE